MQYSFRCTDFTSELGRLMAVLIICQYFMLIVRVKCSKFDSLGCTVYLKECVLHTHSYLPVIRIRELERNRNELPHLPKARQATAVVFLEPRMIC